MTDTLRDIQTRMHVLSIEVGELERLLRKVRAETMPRPTKKTTEVRKWNGPSIVDKKPATRRTLKNAKPIKQAGVRVKGITKQGKAIS